eukprot:TRINITY_DN15428_c0_g5_i1.p1 TRINITY_DN15428_c0_g5~~TRINITY_DN15428_c0_g5_i1.p1  ORF type:complete len:1554 (-),score=231.41 TRINITY_DN15428_c0_g5_i1:177-4838(-)
MKAALLDDGGGRRERICKAAWQFENAVFHRLVPAYPKEIISARNHYLQMVTFDKIYNRAMVILVILTFMEVPAWCHEASGANDIWKWMPGDQWCQAPREGADLNLSGMWYLPPGYALVIEIAIEIIILRKFYLQYKLDDGYFKEMEYEFYPRSTTRMGVFLAIGSAIDTAVFVWFRYPLRLTFIFRTGLLFLLPGIQHLFYNVFTPRLVSEFLSVASFLFGTMIFFAWIALTLFQDLNIVAYEAEGEEMLVNKGFDSFATASYTMFVAAITAEWTECFMPTFTYVRASGIMWFLFLVLCQILLKNIVLDTLVSAYLSGAEVEQETMADSKAGGIIHAFDTLTDQRPHEDLSKQDFVGFALAVGESARMKPVPRKLAELIHDEHAPITRSNFIDVCSIFQGNFTITYVNSCVAESRCISCLSPDGWLYAAVSEPPDAPAFDVFMNKVLIVNMITVIAESVYDLNGIPEPAFFNYTELVFSFAYVTEVLIKLSVKSWAEYWSFAANKFDFFCTWLLLLTSLLPYLQIASLQTDLSHYANILRLLRLLRILKQLKQYPRVQFMVITITRIFEACAEILSLLALAMFFFANVGVNCFGGILYEGNEALNKTEYEEKHWFSFNFNDMFMACALWFNQLLVEYAPVYADALYNTAAWPELAWWIFPAFYFICSAIMFELLAAFTVQVFMECKAEFYDVDEEDDHAAWVLEHEHTKHEHGGHGDKHGHEEHGTNGRHGEHKPHGEHEHHEEHEEHEFCPEKFLDELKPCFEKRGLSLHYSARSDVEFQREVKEEYEELSPESPHALRNGTDVSTIAIAAWEIENVVQDKEMHKFPQDVIAAQKDRFRCLRATKWYNRAIVCLVILTMIEVPPWCHGHATKKSMWAWRPGEEWCEVPTHNGVPGNAYLSGIWYLPPGYALVASAVIELIILRKFILEYFLERQHFMPNGIEYKSLRLIKCGCLFAVGSILDTALFALVHQPIRLTFVFRTGLLFLLPGPQRLFFRIFSRKMAGEWASIAVFFIGNTLLFAWVVVTIFQNAEISGKVAWTTKEGEILANHGFENLRSAIYSMFVAGTTETFADVFMPSFVAHRWFGIIWLLYLLIAQVLLLNLVVDAFVSAYLKNSEELEEEQAETQAHQIYSAFQSLSGGTQHIAKDVFLEFTSTLSRSPIMKPLKPEIAEAMYDHVGTMSKDTFCDICNVLQSKVWLVGRDSFVKRCAPCLWRSSRFQWVHDIVWYPKEAPAFDVFMNWVLTFNLVLIVVESYLNANAYTVPSWVHILSRGFTWSYVVEVLVKLSVKSFAEYWSSPANQFDFYTTWLLLGATLLKYLPIAGLQGNLSHYANILRLLRLVRIIKQLKKYPSVQFMAFVVVRMVEASGDILALLGTMMFFFVTFSVNFFGGLLYEGNPRLAGLAYEEKHWFIFNYNDSLMAFSTWFTSLLEEYVPAQAEAVQNAVPVWGDVAWYTLPLFYVIGVSILFEVLVAFTVETFLALKEQLDGDEEKEDEEEVERRGKAAKRIQEAMIQHVQNKLAEDGERLHYTTRGAASSLRRVLLAYAEKLEEH